MANAWASVKQSSGGGGGGGRGEGHEEEGKERGGGGGRGGARGGGEGGMERSYMKKGVSGGGWSTYKYEAPPVLTEDTGSDRSTAFRPITVQGGERQDMEQGAGQGQGQEQGQGQSMDRGWRNTDNYVEDMGENTGDASHTTSTAANVQNFASNAMKSISTTLFSTSTSRPIQTYAIHQKVNTTDGDERNANRRGRDRGEENGALSSQLADEETVTF